MYACPSDYSLALYFLRAAAIFLLQLAGDSLEGVGKCLQEQKRRRSAICAMDSSEQSSRARARSMRTEQIVNLVLDTIRSG